MGGQTTQRLHQHHGRRGAVLAQYLDARVAGEHLVIGRDRRPELGGAGSGGAFRLADQQRLDALAAHHRAQAAAGREAVRPAAHVPCADGRGRHQHLAGRADRQVGVAVAEIGLEPLGGRLQPQPVIIRRGHEAHGVGVPAVDHQHHRRRVGWERTRHDHSAVAQVGKPVAHVAARVALLDAAGEGTLRAHGEPARVRDAPAGEGAGGENQGIARVQGVAAGIDLARQDLGREQPPAAEDVIPGFRGRSPACQIDAQ